MCQNFYHYVNAKGKSLRIFAEWNDSAHLSGFFAKEQ